MTLISIFLKLIDLHYSNCCSCAYVYQIDKKNSTCPKCELILGPLKFTALILISKLS